jgi:hypothetical protein
LLETLETMMQAASQTGCLLRLAIGFVIGPLYLVATFSQQDETSSGRQKQCIFLVPLLAGRTTVFHYAFNVAPTKKKQGAVPRAG